ncbi:MAG: sigma-70 family RNA polymerase sigma factor [Deltaproteobacteria bacterium]|nr:sigma-70 family RNA polymerase sigma factor [Deltaproteobacteria bacterium]
MLGYLTRFFGDRELATDLTQDVFMRVIRSAGRFRGDSSFTTFLYRIVRNLCVDVMRSRAAHPDSRAASLERTAGPDDRPLAETIPGREPDGEDRALSGELSRALAKGLERLPPEQREVFLMREVEGLRFAEIASILDVNENTVKSRMHYAVVSLRKALAAFREGP